MIESNAPKENNSSRSNVTGFTLNLEEHLFVGNFTQPGVRQLMRFIDALAYVYKMITLASQ
jgi:hypothetical protein